MNAGSRPSFGSRYNKGISFLFFFSYYNQLMQRRRNKVRSISTSTNTLATISNHHHYHLDASKTQSANTSTTPTTNTSRRSAVGRTRYRKLKMIYSMVCFFSMTYYTIILLELLPTTTTRRHPPLVTCPRKWINAQDMCLGPLVCFLVDFSFY
jgi:hypothetical protein